MPTRDIKESCRTSKTLAKISHGAERLFWRLTTYADDFGRMPADAGVLRGQCFSAMLDTVREKDVAGWLAELEAADLVRTYQDTSGNSFAFFPTWEKHQRTRAKHSKYPSPADVGRCRQMPADVAVVTEEPVVPVVAENTDSRSLSTSARNGSPTPAHAVLAFLNHKTGRHYQPNDTNLALIRARLTEGATEEQCRAIIGLKTAKWSVDEKMAEFLRPKTLFNRTNFAQYQGELPATAFQPEDNGHAD